MVILKLGVLVIFINGNCRKSVIFKLNKSIEKFEDIFEKRRLFLISLVILFIFKVDEWVSFYKIIVVIFFCIGCLYYLFV